MSDFVTSHYGPRADDYVNSATHASGEDLQHLTKLVRDEKPDNALDLGCGGGHVSYAIAPYVRHVIAYDPTLSMAAAARAEAVKRGLAQIWPVGGFAEALPFNRGAFDVVASRFSAHHWTNLDDGLLEARRVLRTGGLGLFIDTVAPEQAMADSVLQAMETLRDPSHMRNYRVSEWTRSLVAAGFKIQTHIPMRLRLEFDAWIARTQTSDLHRDALCSLVQKTDRKIRQYFAIEPDGSFTIDTALFVVR